MDEIEYLNIDDDSTGNQSYNQMSNQDNTTLDATSDSPPGLKIKERVKFPSNWACTSTRGSDELEGNSTLLSLKSATYSKMASVLHVARN